MTIVAKPCPVELAPITWQAANRPALPMPSPSYVTVHEVGNTNTNPPADEDMHKAFVHNGGGINNVSFHFVVGPKKAIQLIYLNENAWHASDNYGGTGNRDSIAIETIQVGDFDLTLSHLAWLIAEIFRNPQRFAYRPDIAPADDLDPSLAAERMRQHHDWAPDGKNCPEFIRNRGLWRPLIDAVVTELSTSAIPVYSPPELPVWWNNEAIEQGIDRTGYGARMFACSRRYTAIRETVCRTKPDNDAPKTRPNLRTGESFEGRFILQDSGKRWWTVSKYGSCIRMSALTPDVRIAPRVT